jgi:hypothetical protein
VSRPSVGRRSPRGAITRSSQSRVSLETTSSCGATLLLPGKASDLRPLHAGAVRPDPDGPRSAAFQRRQQPETTNPCRPLQQRDVGRRELPLDQRSATSRSARGTRPTSAPAAPPAASAQAGPATPMPDGPSADARRTCAPTRASTAPPTRGLCGSARTAPPWNPSLLRPPIRALKSTDPPVALGRKWGQIKRPHRAKSGVRGHRAPLLNQAAGSLATPPRPAWVFFRLPTIADAGYRPPSPFGARRRALAALGFRPAGACALGRMNNTDTPQAGMTAGNSRAPHIRTFPATATWKQRS